MALFIGLCFISIFFFSLFFSEKACSYFYQCFVYQKDAFFYWGLLFFLFTTFFGLTLYVNNKGSYFTVKMSSVDIEVDKNLLQGLIDVVIERDFSSMNMESSVEVKEDNSIWIETKIDSLSSKEQKWILQKLEKKIGKELSESLAYKAPFYLTLKMR